MEKKEGWLIVWQRPKESIYIGEEIEISVNKIQGNQVWLAIRSPQDVKILKGASILNLSQRKRISPIDPDTAS